MLEFSNVTKRYGNQTVNAVDDLTLAIEGGQIFGFLGPNGAGKSTTIKMLVGLLRQDSGTILLDGLSMQQDSLQVKSQIGYVPDEPLFYEKMTGVQHLNFISDMFGLDAQTRKERVDDLAQRFSLQAALKDEISSYSHGMKQKLAVISALVHQPKLLVLDEPMVGLDPKAAFLLKQTLATYVKEGNTVFFSTHVLEVAQTLCDTLGIIRKGKLLYSGSFEDLQSKKGNGEENLEQLFLELVDEGGKA